MDGQPAPNDPDRRGDRQRRLTEATKLAPYLGVLMFLFPLLLSTGEGWSTAWVGIYLFSGWAGLIVLIGLLSRRLSGQAEDTSGAQDGPHSREGRRP